MKTAILLGATGLTGGLVLERLLDDDEYSTIKIFSRRSVDLTDPKIEEHIIDLFDLENYREHFTGDVLFCCLGSTKAKTPDLELYRKIDHGLPVLASRIAGENGIKRFLVISALGADIGSSFFYNRIKGEMERDVRQQHIEEIYIFRPPLIGGNRREKRVFEFLWKKLMKVVNYLMWGPLRKYRSMHPDIIAKAMVLVAANGYPQTIIGPGVMRAIASGQKK